MFEYMITMACVCVFEKKQPFRLTKKCLIQHFIPALPVLESEFKVIPPVKYIPRDRPRKRWSHVLEGGRLNSLSEETLKHDPLVSDKKQLLIISILSNFNT